MHSIHKDLSEYAADDGAVVNDLLNGGNTSADIASWHTDLSTFQQDATNLQGDPAPSCGGGRQLSLAAPDWLKAATAYKSAAQILASSPNLSGVSASDHDMNVGNREHSRAKAALKRAESQSDGLIKIVSKGTGT